ncbi:uncharacterized protein CANTADRAFT_218602 [Suhomyces tanzawaensis NRRL Y-17324]|uniref:Uncharacterized protein n=1 Tax=Suhomyces tanzawaensis NRRL Y-17324 TaxID=984487 RepID=A0A1E4SK68_9ASCO|nr:uncharacterized protein CANTADRAFT_218602 [Suhomyces tanzawaensis NRRL Y-17324]ODV79888.1 hypothetical protein CANTADRAFT_218602 [Suhomyces tanzawaensis NRRL Y-17324]
MEAPALPPNCQCHQCHRPGQMHPMASLTSCCTPLFLYFVVPGSLGSSSLMHLPWLNSKLLRVKKRHHFADNTFLTYFRVPCLSPPYLANSMPHALCRLLLLTSSHRYLG